MKCNECIWWDTTQTFDNKKNCCKCMNPNAPGYKMWRKWNNNLCKGYGERRKESEGQNENDSGAIS